MTIVTHIDVCWDIALNAGIVIGEPRSANIVSGLEYGMLDYVPHGRKSVLELVCHDQAGEASANSEDPYFPRSVSILCTQLEGIESFVFVNASISGSGEIGCHHLFLS